VLVAGYLGLIPGLADVFGANKPRDLGVRYTQADYTNYLAKTNTQVFDFAQAPVAPARPTDTIVYTDPQAKTVSLSNSELSARAGSSKWKDLPISDIQIKCEANGVVEVSGKLLSDRLANFATIAGNGGYSATDVKTGLDWLNIIGKDPAIYLKGTASVTNNVPSLQISSAQINRFSLPSDAVSVGGVALAKSLFARVTGLDAKSVTFSENALNFIGTAPTKVYVKQ
jgi:hypothetical protein